MWFYTYSFSSRSVDFLEWMIEFYTWEPVTIWSGSRRFSHILNSFAFFEKSFFAVEIVVASSGVFSFLSSHRRRSFVLSYHLLSRPGACRLGSSTHRLFRLACGLSSLFLHWSTVLLSSVYRYLRPGLLVFVPLGGNHDSSYSTSTSDLLFLCIGISGFRLLYSAAVFLMG